MFVPKGRGKRRPHATRSSKAPVKKSNAPPAETVQLQVERLADDGRGIAYLDGKTTFVEGAIGRTLLWAVNLPIRELYMALS